MRVVVVYRPETAMRPEVLEIDGVRVLHGEGVVMFEPTEAGGTFQRGWVIPLRYLAQVHLEHTPEQNLLSPSLVVDLTAASSRPGAPAGVPASPLRRASKPVLQAASRHVR